MSEVCGRADAYVAGALSAGEEESFLLHVAACARCQAELDDDGQLQALEHEARRQPERGRVIPFQPRRLRRAALIVVPVLAAAAALLLLARERGGRPADQPAAVALALAPTRAIEPRFTWTPADQFRPYAVARGAAGADDGAESISAEAIAGLQRAGDGHGVAIAWALAGDRRRAASALDAAGHDVDLDSDRAALALLDGDAERALGLAEAVLRAAPDHRQALWNRGLALRALGLPLAAAEDFARVGALDPAWRGEAETRARALRAQVEEQRDAWFAARDAGYAMLAGGEVLPAATARRFPGSARLFLYDALRVAPTPARVSALRPLAVELDRVYGGGVLVAQLERALGRHDFAARQALAADYVRLVRGELGGADPAVDALLARGPDDLRLGVLLLAGRAPARAAEYRRLASRVAGADPWFELLALDVEAQGLLAAGDAEAAEARWLELRARCEHSNQGYRCGQAELNLARLYTDAHRFADARAAAARAAERASQGGEWTLTSKSLAQRAQIEFFHERWPLARSLLREVRLAAPDHCPTQRWAAWLDAQVAIFERHPDQAFAAAHGAPVCTPQTWSNDQISALVDLARYGRPVMDMAAAREVIAGRRAQAPSPADAAFLDYAEGRLLLDGDRVAGERLLEAALAAARGLDDELARSVARAALDTLAVHAASRGEWDAFFARMSRLAAPAGPRCVVAVAIDDARAAIAVRGADGQLRSEYQATRGDLEPATLVRQSFVDALAGCPTVAVYASPLLVGRPELLPPELPWAYRVGPGAGTPGTPGTPSTTTGHRLVVAETLPPAALGLPALTAPAAGAGALLVRGAEAHPARVLAEMADATAIEIHAHGLVDLARSNAPLLALSPGPDGQWAFTVEALRGRRLGGAPVVALADCGAGLVSAYEAWGLPTALLAAGARAVVAARGEIVDPEAAVFFTALLDRIGAGEAPAAALAAMRMAWLERAPWVRDVMLFE